MSSSVFTTEAALSSRRSVSRSRVKVTLHDHGGSMLFTELADRCGMTTKRLEAVIFGDDQDFSVARAPFTLGHVFLVETPMGRVVVLSDTGHEEAVQLLREPFWALGRDRR